MTEDWAEDAMLKAFPRDGNTYFMQLVDEPVLKTVKGQWGPYTTLSVGLQFFSVDLHGDFHYIGPAQFKGKSCVFEDFSSYRHILLDVMYEAVGFKHGQHTDLDIKKTYDRQYPGKTQSEDGNAPSVPLKHTEGEERLADATSASPSTPCSVHAIMKCPKCHPEEWS